MTLSVTKINAVLVMDYGALVERYWWQNQSTGTETCDSATLFTTNITWTDLGSNTGFCAEKLMTIKKLV
jgi:hypothetical protein